MQSRRQFLRRVALSLGSSTPVPRLKGCGQISTEIPTQPSATPQIIGRPPTVPTAVSSPEPTQEMSTATPALSPSPSLAYPDLVVARQGEPEDLVRRPIAALGGMERFITPGSKVVVKPNICHDYFGYEYAAT